MLSPKDYELSKRPVVTTSIQYYIRNSSKCNKARRGNEIHSDKKGRLKLYLFTVDIIVRRKS